MREGESGEDANVSGANAPAPFQHLEPIRLLNDEHGVRLSPPPPIRRGHCMDVWVVCEHIRRDLGRVPTREEVLGDARLARSNHNNVNQEFHRWKRWRNEEAGGSKVMSAIEAGKVLFPESAPWLGTFLKEVLTFPMSKYDDQVDSMAQAIKWMETHIEYATHINIRWC